MACHKVVYSKTCAYRNALGTGFGLNRVFGEEQTKITCTIDMRVIIQDVSPVGLQMKGVGLCK